MAPYLTAGKRSIIQVEMQAQVNAWAKVAGVQPPTVKIRQKNRAMYYRKSRTMIMAPHSTKDSLVHEFAHHLVVMDGGAVSRHGIRFRLALVEAAAIAYGRAARYAWGSEYRKVAQWAQKVGLGSQFRVRG